MNLSQLVAFLVASASLTTLGAYEIEQLNAVQEQAMAKISQIHDLNKTQTINTAKQLYLLQHPEASVETLTVEQLVAENYLDKNILKKD